MAGTGEEWKGEDDFDDFCQTSQRDLANLEQQMSSSKGRRQANTLKPPRQSSRRLQRENIEGKTASTLEWVKSSSRQDYPSTSRSPAFHTPSTSRSSAHDTPSTSRSGSHDTPSSNRAPSHRMRTRVSRLETSFNQSEECEDVNRATLQQRITSAKALASSRSQSRPTPVRPSSSRELQPPPKKAHRVSPRT